MGWKKRERPSLIDDSEKVARVNSGRPRKTFDLDELRRLKEVQCTDTEACHVLGISHDTLQRRLADDPAVYDAYYGGIADGKYKLRRAQFRAATREGDESDAMLKWLGKNWLGQSEDNNIILSGGETPIKIDMDVNAQVVAALKKFDEEH